MSLIEVVIASAIVLLLSAVLVSANFAYLRTFNTSLKTIKAVYLVEEGIEAVNLIKNNDWNGLGNIGTDSYLVWNGTTWLSTTSQSMVDQIYERKFMTEEVYRDSSDDIVLAGGTLDSNTRRLTVSVSWLDNSATTTKSISTYIMKDNE